MDIGVYCCGQVRFCGAEESHDQLRQILGKAVADYGDYPDACPVSLCIDAHTFYPRVERVLQILNEVRIFNVNLVVTGTNADTACRTAFLDVLATDMTRTDWFEQGERDDTHRIVPVVLAGEQTRIGDKTFARSQVATELGCLAKTSRCYVVSCSRSNTVQDLVSFLALCEEHTNASVFLHVPTTSTNAPRVRVLW